MKILFYISKILLYISMAIFGFLNLTGCVAMIARVGYPVYGWVLLGTMVLGYAGILVFNGLKKYLPMFISSAVFPITSLVTGLTLRALPIVKKSYEAGGFDKIVIRNHFCPMLIILFAFGVWFTYFMMPEQRAKRRESDYRQLNPDEKIL